MRKQQQAMTGWFPRAALVTALACACGAPAWAQQQGDPGNAAQSPPPKPAVAPPPADLEPGVNTSATQPSSSEAPVAQPAAPQSASKPAKSAGSAKSESAAKAAPGAPPAAAATGAPKSTGPAGKAHDTLQLDETQITGNRELPKVLYIVPWKRSDLGDLVGKPVNSLVDEVLAPVDRDVFKRQNRYYDALKPDGAQEPAGAAAKP